MSRILCLLLAFRFLSICAAGLAAIVDRLIPAALPSIRARAGRGELAPDVSIAPNDDGLAVNQRPGSLVAVRACHYKSFPAGTRRGRGLHVQGDYELSIFDFNFHLKHLSFMGLAARFIYRATNLAACR